MSNPEMYPGELLNNKENPDFAVFKQNANSEIISNLKGLLSYNENNEKELQEIFDESKTMDELASKMEDYFSEKSKDGKANLEGFLDRINKLKANNDVKEYFDLLN